MTEPLTQVYFSDAFRLSDKVLEDYGAFNVSLLNDLPLFIDPFLLFNSTDSEYQSLHRDIIRYLVFLRDKATGTTLDDGHLEQWFTFHEVRQNWLGYSLQGNKGSGLGMDFARTLAHKLATTFRSFGEETVSQSSHLEKLTLVDEGIGRDNISDLTTNLVKGYLLSYTQRFATQHLAPHQRRTVPVAKAVFNYHTETWETRRYDLPWLDNDFVLLTPLDLLTKDDNWINKEDIYRDYPDIVDSVPNTQLRSQINNYYSKCLATIQRRDDEARRKKAPSKKARPQSAKARLRALRRDPTKRQTNEAVAETITQFPAFIDYYVRWKEEHGDEAEANADARVRASERVYIRNVRELCNILLKTTAFYSVPGSTFDEAGERIAFLKDIIENKGGWRLFYDGEKPVPREADLHIMFRLTWLNSPSDVNREVNNGRGPSDFEISRGRFDKTIVEFKLAKNTALPRNLQHQVEAYEAASDAQYSYKVIVYFDDFERQKVRSLLKELGLDKDPHVVVIDARPKASASKIASQD